MASSNILIGCIGKPNAGKSSFLNASTDAKAKVGNYSFTTIEPNVGVAFYACECPCARLNKSNLCKPRYGRCIDGKRYVPVKVLDVAGLIPGASSGLGLGNKFLDDLRHADVLLHVVDASGTTNAKGEPSEGYDPLLDVRWLREEIEAWIFGNLWKKWSSVTRRHSATNSTAANTCQLQMSGYGARPHITQRTLDVLGVKEPSDLPSWGEEEVKRFVSTFVTVRFPTVLVANKCDMGGAEMNIARMCEEHGEENVVPCSALAECFLRRMVKQKYIQYESGADDFRTVDDVGTDSGLKELDEKVRSRLEHIRDLVLYRYRSTGVEDAIQRAVDLVGLVPIYPVRSLTNFTCDRSEHVFQDCFLAKKGTTIRDIARMLSPELNKNYGYAEDANGMRLAEDEEVSMEKSIIRFHKGTGAETSNT